MNNKFIMIKKKSPAKILICYLLFCLFLLISQSSVSYEFSYGLLIILSTYGCFCLGMYIANSVKLPSKMRRANYSQYDKVIYTKIIVILLLVINVLIMLYLSYSFIQALNRFDSMLKYRESLFIGRALVDYFGPYAGYMFFFVTLTAIFGISFGLFEKLVFNKKSILITSLLLLLGKEALLMSRYYIVAPFISMFIIMYCYDLKMSNRRIIALSFFFSAAMILLFALRGGTDGGYGNIVNARNYLIIGFSMFSQLIDNDNLNRLAELASPFSFLGLAGTKLYNYQMFFNEIQQFISLGEAGKFNAFYTSFLLVYIYFGVAGLAGAIFIFGFLLIMLHKQFIYTRNFSTFNVIFSMLILFFTHQFFPVQLSFFWDYFLLSLFAYFSFTAATLIRRQA